MEEKEVPDRRRAVKGILAATAVAAVGSKIVAPEVRREWRDRFSTGELEESIKRRIADVSGNFGIRVNTDVRDLWTWEFGIPPVKRAYNEMDSRSVLDDYFALIEEILWTLPPDTLSNYVDTITSKIN